MNNPIDLLQIKIEKAKRELPVETVNAIDSVDWRAAILGLRDKYGYTFEQLGNLELETELLLCGLVGPEGYPKELETRMGISKESANGLVNEMNDLVFKKIREELIKNTERKKIFADKSTVVKPEEEKTNTNILNSAGIKIIPQKFEQLELEAGKPIEGREDILKKIEKPDAFTKSYSVPKEELHPILAQKLSGSFKIPMVTTEHTLENITKTANETKTPVPQAPKVDPYREIPG